MRKLIPFLLVGLFFVGGCNPGSQFSKARELEKEGEFYEAWERYQKFVARHPDHPKAAEALFRAGWVAQKGLGDCFVAINFYEDVIARYPQAAYWSKAAALQRQNCPDYFPLVPGSEWVEGDSDTKGGIARTDIKCRALTYTKDVMPSQAGILARTFYAGRKRFKSTQYVYKKEKDELLEFSSETDPRAKTILRGPFKVGTTWRTRMSGRFFRFEIVDVNARVKVAAGTFEGCLKVKSLVEGAKGARFDYYAPGVGRILTTLSSTSGEKRNTELISYDIAPIPDFGPNEKKEKPKEKK